MQRLWKKFGLKLRILICVLIIILIYFSDKKSKYFVRYHAKENNLRTFMNDNFLETSFMCRIAISQQFNPSFADILEKIPRIVDIPDNLTNQTDCELFKWIDGEEPAISDEELQFPLAFSFNVHKEFKQFARLLRAVYRKHNAYCVHLDSKSDAQLRAQIESLVKCLGSNVHLIPLHESHSMKWGDLSTLEAWILCATFLLHKSPVQWKYLLNGSGQEFPLRTNWELVKALKAINGSNIVESDYPDSGKGRAPSIPLSFNITWFKSSFYTALRREMVIFSLTNKNATELLSTLRTEGDKVKLQDEVFFTTLTYNPHLKAPGGCPEVHRPNDADPRSAFVGRYAEWKPSEMCLSKRSQSSVCIQGVRNLPYLIKRPEFFVNKFIYDFQPFAYDCIEWWMFQKIKYERYNRKTAFEFNTTFYSNLYCSQNHL